MYRFDLKRLLLCFFVIYMGDVFAADDRAIRDEYKVKVAVVYNIAKFVTWKEKQNKEQFNVCSYGSGSLASAVSILQGKTIGNNLLAVRSLGKQRDALVDCDVLFISEKSAAVLNSLPQGSSVLTVSDAQGFANKGGMIELVNLDNKIRFNINQSAIRSAGLHISAKVLRLAVKVFDKNKVIRND